MLCWLNQKSENLTSGYDYCLRHLIAQMIDLSILVTRSPLSMSGVPGCSPLLNINLHFIFSATYSSCKSLRTSGRNMFITLVSNFKKVYNQLCSNHNKSRPKLNKLSFLRVSIYFAELRVTSSSLERSKRTRYNHKRSILH